MFLTVGGDQPQRDQAASRKGSQKPDFASARQRFRRAPSEAPEKEGIPDPRRATQWRNHNGFRKLFTQRTREGQRV